jgi:hypothetical protein
MRPRGLGDLVYREWLAGDFIQLRRSHPEPGPKQQRQLAQVQLGHQNRLKSCK